jgi:RNA polymerase sigma-70 factor (ECF subfamily)
MLQDCYPSDQTPPLGSASHSSPASGRSLESGAEFEALFHRLRDPLRSFLFQKLRSNEDAEDAVALTFYKAWRARHTFRGEACPAKWLYGIAARIAIDIIRGRRRRPEEQYADLEGLDARLPLSDEQADPAKTVVDREGSNHCREAIREAFERLSPEQRRLAQLYYFEERKYEEISSLLGVPYTCLRGRLHTIRRALRKDLEDRQRWGAS